MMKRLLFTLCTFMLISYSIVAQNPSEKKYNHWSLGLKAGVDRGEFSGSGILSDDASYGFTFGVELERTFNPLWGLFLEYEYINYSNFDIDAYTNEISVLGSINFANLLAKYRPGGWQKLNAYGRLGGGISMYSALTNQKTIVIPMGAALEYDINDYLAIGLTGERRWHTSGYMGLGRKLQERATIWSILANVRIKFGSNHIRNTSLVDFENAKVQIASKDQPREEVLQRNAPENENVSRQLNELKDQMDRTNAEVEKLKEDLDKTTKELNEAKDDLTRYYKEDPNEHYYSAPKEKITAIEAKNIEFELGSTVLKESSHGELDNIIKHLEENPELNLEVIGHTDAIGGIEVNQMISLDRAKTVRNYLVKKGIDINRISVQGMGYSKPIGNNATAEGRAKNRRVEFVFSNK